MQHVQEAGVSPKRAHSMESGAEQLGVSVFTLWAHKKRGTLRTIKIGRRVLIPEDELQRIAAAGLPSLSQRHRQGGK
jgi:excisionase family DNA binding protein